MDLTARIDGGLAGAVIGDSMGTATETMSRRRIKERFGYLTEMVAPDDSPFSQGSAAGTFSDDSSQMLLLAERIVRRGAADQKDVVDMLLEWAADEEMFARTAGPTTRAAVARLREGEDPAEVGKGNVHTGSGLSNGAAMKTAPAGWIHPGDWRAAVADAAQLAIPTHNTSVAIAGAGAVAAAVAMAAVGASLDEVIAVGVDGAKEGERLGLITGREAASASVADRIELAVDLARAAESTEDMLDRMYSIVGSGLPTNEAVPSAFGILAATGGDFTDAVVAAINVGNDTDTVATIVGAIVGTMTGRAGVPDHWYDQVVQVNKLDLLTLAQGLAGLSHG